MSSNLVNMPPDWEKKKISELSKDKIVQTGPFGSLLHSYDYAEEGVPLLLVRNIEDGQYVPECPKVNFEKATELKKFWLEEGDIVFTRVGAVGRTLYIDKRYKGWMFSGQTLRLRIRNENINNEFINYYFRSAYFNQYVESIALGTTRPSLNTSIIEKLKVPLPPKKEQDKIVDILKRIDEKIELNNRMNGTLEAVGEAVFRRWFVDFEFPDEEGKPYKSSGGKMVDSNFGPIPQGWNFGKLGDVVSVLETGSRPKGGIQEVEEGVPSIGAESIESIGGFDFSKTKHISKEFYNSMKRGKVQDHDVLLYKDGGRPGDFIPKITMVGKGYPFAKCCINSHVYRIRANAKSRQSFLYLWLSTKRIKEEMNNRATGVAIPGINSTEVKNLPIIIPEKDILNEFDNIITPLFDKIFTNCLESKILTQIRDLLLPKLMSGKIRVPVNEDKVEAC